MLREYYRIGDELADALGDLTLTLHHLVPHVHFWKKSKRARRNVKHLLRKAKR